MSHTLRIVLITVFAESGAMTVFRGMYFFTHDHLNFTARQNLLLALGFGASYVLTALSSARLTGRLGERHTAMAATTLQMLGSVLLFTSTMAWTLIPGVLCVSIGYGLFWPILESYAVAGSTPRQATRTIGVFNLSWACAAPVALWLTGPILAWHGPLLFVFSLGTQTAMLGLLLLMPRRPTRLPHDHPEHPPPHVLRRYQLLLIASRWSMVASFAMLWVMAAVLPQILDSFEVDRRIGPGLEAVLDLALVVGLGVMFGRAWWPGRARWAALTAVALPVGFVTVLLKQSLLTVLLGEMIFGLAMGFAYYSALYYAMVIKNAAVHASGQHEGTIGMGMLIGPLTGLLAQSAAAELGHVPGTLLGVAPLVIVCALGGLLPLRKLSRTCPQTSSAAD